MKDILLAEDDLDDVAIFNLAVSELNIPYKLRHAENGDALLVLLKDKIPYLLFLDIHMPCKDGVACIVEIRKNKEYDRLPIIMYTSHVAATMIDECFRNGANLYLTKAATINELTTKLKTVFSIDWGNYLHYPPVDSFILS